MGYELHIDREGHLARISLLGQISVEEQQRWLDALVGHPDWSPGFDMLVDTRKLGGLMLSYDQTRAAAQHAKRLDERLGDGRHAVIGDTDMLFGCARMGEQLSRPCSRQIAVFRDVEAAERWLGIRDRETIPDPPAGLRKAQEQPEVEEAGGGKRR
jgi:hypothetical protein